MMSSTRVDNRQDTPETRSNVSNGNGYSMKDKAPLLAKLPRVSSKTNSKKSWIASTFSRRECIRFIVNPKKPDGPDPDCQCGRAKSKHTSKALGHDTTATDWNPDRFTRQLPTNAYGEVEFQGTGSQNRSPYVRLSHDTDANKVLDLMLKRWNLEVPNLVISVTGGAKSFVLKPRLKEVFRRGLVKAAKTTGAWIITGGTNTGVMKHVGEAVKEQQLMLGSDSEVHVIGIASWGIVDKQNSLIQEKGASGRYPAVYSMEPTPGFSGAMLDSNHSHFLLVDNGTKGKYGVEISLRSRVEEGIMGLKTDSRSKAGSIGVPVVLLVLEGGPNTVQTMYELIQKKVPAVVIDGSGRAANVVAFAYSHTVKKTVDGQTISVIDPAYEDEVKSKVNEVFSFLGESGVNSLYEKIKCVLEDEKMVSVYRLEDGAISQEIDLAILKALLKANRSSPLAQLNLALAWNRIDLAKSDIFTEDRLWTTEQLSGPMITALLDDKADFAELFLHSGLSMSEFLTTEILCQLYAGVPTNSTIKPLLQKEMNKVGLQNISMQIVGEVVEQLMGDMYVSQYLRNGQYFEDVTENNAKFGSMSLKRMLSRSSMQPASTHNINLIDPIPTPYRDVFLWAVLCNRRELARVLWEAGRQPVAAALMACKLLRSLANKAHSDDTITDVSQDLNEHAKMFEERAIGVLDECFGENETLSQTLLVRELEHFGHLTCLDLAVSGDSQNFISHTACQVLLTRLWMGAMAMNTTSFKVMLCMFVPFLIFPIIYFVPDEHHERQEAERRHKQSLEASRHDNGAVVPTYRSKTDNRTSIDEEAKVGLDEEEDEADHGHFAIEEYIPEIRPDDSMEVMLRSKNLSVCQRIYAFYSAPFTKFAGNVVSYLAFILLYAYVIMMNFPKFDENKTVGGISAVEILLYFWVFSIFIEECRQLASKAPKSIWDKISIYLSDPWNFVDILSIVAFFTAVALRFFEDTFTAAHIVLSLDIIIFIARSLQIFSVNRHLGPRLVMIRKMMDDLKQFVIILLVFLIAYGISLEAIMFPGPGEFARNDTWKSIQGVLELPYWQMYGELFLDEIKGEKPGDFGAVSPTGKQISPLLLALFMLLANVLLLNLLIAIFSYTFELIQEDSDKVWKFQRYDLVQEYHSRPIFSPPLILIGHLFVFIRWIWQLCRCGNPPKGSSMKLTLTGMEMEQIDNWEFQAAETFSYQTQADTSDKLEERVKALGERVNNMANKLDRLMDNVLDPQKKIAPSVEESVQSGDPSTDGRLGRLEVNLTSNNEMLSKILKLLEAGNSVPRPPASATTIEFIHHKARSSPYPGSTIKREDVPDNKVDWEVNFPGYKPVEYTAPVVLSKPPWADPDLMSMAVKDRPKLKYNQLDTDYNVDRTSYNGKYKGLDGLPQNPMGRTGMAGRGLLGRFGPNHAADPIVTRWKRTSAGVMVEGGKKVLEFVAILRKDNNQWAIPGGMVEPGQAVTQTLKAEFGEEALAKINVSPEERERIGKQIERLFQKGDEIYKGYVDDPRNTDNSWMETLAVNFHDEKGEMFNDFKLQAGDDAAAVRWQRVSGNIPLYASHISILEKVAKLRDAAF
ncbi:transient receptor potential cation channel subfamily M member 2 isoform X2 [Exaiptasia diaphana]|uniref:Nudix hydrolase domain-containing protein n=1 Tax=Exaiptasia diaphana TaxID=2652724 RepID=A0A913YR20_EXADI|nr:transient receptor potential cation channel subfamily M member 2 isoform X2 [Exaiptasia diaphana]